MYGKGWRSLIGRGKQSVNANTVSTEVACQGLTARRNDYPIQANGDLHVTNHDMFFSVEKARFASQFIYKKTKKVNLTAKKIASLDYERSVLFICRAH